MAAMAGSYVRQGNGQPPKVKNPRATDGDEQYEPQWDERLTITVGPKNADLVGHDEKVIQAAVDYMARRGGGTIKLLPGIYTLRNAVFLSSQIRLQGSGPETIITKINSEKVSLSDDSDWYDQEITLEDAASFRVGDGIVLRGKDAVIKRTLIARSGNRFKLDDGLRENLWLSAKPNCSSLFPLLTSEYTHDVVIEDLVLDGNAQNNDNLDGNYAGCIFLQDCNRFTIRRVEAKNYNGDGISFQICHDVSVENCHCHDNTQLGLHPGSGSQRPVIRNNQLTRNNIGLFWCWGVKNGFATGNRILANRDVGMSIGHNDTDNLIQNNTIADSGRIGILFRNDSRGNDFWANRNRLENNRIENSGDKDGIAIDIQGKTRDLVILGNQLHETRQPMNRTGIHIATQAGHITLQENTVKGFAHAIRDERTNQKGTSNS